MLNWTGLTFTWGEKKRQPWDGNLLWGLLYLCFCWLFFIASSPFAGARKRRRKWTIYGVSYNMLLLWIAAGLLGHSPFFLQIVEFDLDEPVSLLFPLFWAGLAVLLSVDFLHYRTQRLLLHYAKAGNTFAANAYDAIRTKFHISFVRSFSEAVMSSFSCSCICVLVHTSLVDTAVDAKLWEWDSYLLLPKNQSERMASYLSNLSPKLVGKVPTSKMSVLWLSFMCVLVIQHLIERITYTRGIFQSDEDEGLQQKSIDLRRRRDSSTTCASPLNSPKRSCGKKSKEFSSTKNISLYPNGETEPRNKKEMASWWDYALTQTVIDVFISINFFSGRFDQRQLLAANIGDTDSAKNGIFVFDHRKDNEGKERQELWLDFMADCGDGFNSSYTISSLLAQPNLMLHDEGSLEMKTLSRGQILMIGGDLAYPRPTPENYESRFFRVFEDALPSPSDVPKYYEHHVSLTSPDNTSTDSKDGPVAYVVPGNHDWYDGLSCFVKYVLYRDWLGGWKLPQKKSYFLLKLPHDWFVFGFDNGLNNDIDPQQAAHFGEYAKDLPESAKVILVQHDPNWVLDQYEDRGRPGKERTGKNIEFLMNGPLRGKVMLRLAGDVHNYMRHEVKKDSHEVIMKSDDDLYSTPTLVVSGGGGAFLHPTHCLGEEDLQKVAGTGGKDYIRKAEYPSVEVSKGLSYQNLTKFRARNWRFDVIGGLIYLALAHSLFTDCIVEHASSKKIHDADALYILQSWFHDTSSAMKLMITGSKLSLFVLLSLWFILVNFVDSGKKGLQYGMGTIHLLLHWFFSAAVSVSIDWLFLSFSSFSTRHQGKLEVQWTKFQIRFPGGAKFIENAGQWTFGLVPSLMRYSMLVADSPHTQAYLKNQIYCNPTSEDYTVLYWTLRVCWYWVIACPVVATVIAVYLWFSLNYLGMHWNEGFSSLQHEGYKNFIRMKINKQGALELYTIGVDKVPVKWELDHQHEKALRSGKRMAHVSNPSRWKPKGKLGGKSYVPRIIDHTVIK